MDDRTVTSDGGTDGPGRAGAAAAELPRVGPDDTWSSGTPARRWWRPAALAGPLVAVVVALLAAAWQAYEAGGCGSATDGFACLGASLMGVVAAAVLGPLALWLLYRSLGLRHPVLAVPVAAAVALCLCAVPELVHQVRLGTGTGPGTGTGAGTAGPVLVPLVAGLVLGAAAAAGALALQGPRRGARGAVAGVLLGALVAVVLGLQPATDREETRLELGRAAVPLLLADGWAPFAPWVGTAGDLTYTAVPPGYEGYGYDGVRVEVDRDVSRFGETCAARDCEDDGDVRTEVGETGDGYGTRAWRVVDGALVTATTDAYGPPADLVGLLQGLRPVPVEEFLDRRYDEPA